MIADTYERDGYVSGIDIFPAEEIAAYRSQFDELEDRLGKETTETGLVQRHLEYEFIWQLSSDERILDVIASCIGNDVMLLATHFFCKYPAGDTEKFVAWHQDVTYWGLDPAEMHTAWVAVDKSDRENGCMQTVAGSHTGGIAPHGNSARAGNLLSVNQEIADEHIDKSMVRHLELEAGQISIHHGKVYHSSNSNISDRRRCGLTLRFIRPEVRQVDPAKNNFKPVLLRGVDSYNHYPATPPPFPVAV
jgi:non-heme Fe2+,alpha-ketoglutarate-dependent halogenase